MVEILEPGQSQLNVKHPPIMYLLVLIFELLLLVKAMEVSLAFLSFLDFFFFFFMILEINLLFFNFYVFD